MDGGLSVAVFAAFLYNTLQLVWREYRHSQRQAIKEQQAIAASLGLGRNSATAAGSGKEAGPMANGDHSADDDAAARVAAVTASTIGGGALARRDGVVSHEIGQATAAAAGAAAAIPFESKSSDGAAAAIELAPIAV